MTTFLLKLLELSLQAGALVLAVLLVRLVFRRIPAKYVCILWLIVAARLVIPFSMESSFAPMRSLDSLLAEKWTAYYYPQEKQSAELDAAEIINKIAGSSGLENTKNQEQQVPGDANDEVYYIGNGEAWSELPAEEVQKLPEEELREETDYFISEGERILHAVPGTDSDDEVDYYITENSMGVIHGVSYRAEFEKGLAKLAPVLFVMWLLGMALLLFYGGFSCRKVNRMVKNAIPYEENVWLCDGLETAFLCGWLHPRIYVPTSLEEPQLNYVIEHEKSHIARGDHLGKLFGYILLAVYWFNPFVWIAYILFCKDVERACDERVISGFDVENRKGYADALLQCSIDHRFAISNPLAFGEMDVKKRILGILHYKKPGRAVAVVAVLFCVLAVTGGFMVQKEDKGGNTVTYAPTVTPISTATPTPTVFPSSEERGNGPTLPTSTATSTPTVAPSSEERGNGPTLPTSTATPTPTAAPSSEERGTGPFTPTPTAIPVEYTWSQTITHIPSDLEHLESDWELLGINTPETLVAVPFGQTVVVDLNGDGTEESVTFGLQGYEGKVSYNKVFREPFFLEINETRVLQGAESIFHGESPCFTTYYIFDIDVTDGYKEIGLADYGPNGDVGVALYRYDNGTVQAIGGFRSAPLESDQPWNSMDYEAVSYEEMVAQVDRENFLISVPGDGTIWAKEREYLLETCGVVSKYQLENAADGLEARLKPAKRERYMFLNWDSKTRIEVTAAREFKTFASIGLYDRPMVTVPEGSQVTFYEYYMPHEDWELGYVRFFYTLEEKWDSEGWLILWKDHIVLPEDLEEEQLEAVEPDELFHNLNHAG